MNEPSVSEAHVSDPVVSAPLDGKRVLLTRAKQEDAIARALRLAGAQVDALALTVSTPLESAQLDEARDRLADGAYAWVVFSSWRAARADRKSTRLNSSHIQKSRMPSSA